MHIMNPVKHPDVVLCENSLFAVNYFRKTLRLSDVRFGTKYSRMGQVKFVEQSLKILKGYGLLKQAISLQNF